MSKPPTEKLQQFIFGSEMIQQIYNETKYTRIFTSAKHSATIIHYIRIAINDQEALRVFPILSGIQIIHPDFQDIIVSRKSLLSTITLSEVINNKDYNKDKTSMSNFKAAVMIHLQESNTILGLSSKSPKLEGNLLKNLSQ